MKRFLSLILVLSLLLGLGITAAAEDMSGQIVILHTNDTHGRIAHTETQVGFAGAAALKDYYESLGAYVLLLDAGDFSQGTNCINIYSGQNVIELMNMAGYDAACIGNHEFDYPVENLLKMQEDAQFELLCANVFAGDETLLPARMVFTTPEGVDIGVFSLLTVDSLNPQNTAGLDISMDEEELYDIAEAQVDAMEKIGCEYIVCLSHLGTDGGSEPFRSVDVIGRVPGIDLFIDGHSHTAFDDGEMVEDTLLVSTGEYFQNIGCVTIDGGDMAAKLIPAAEITEYDVAVNAVAEEYIAATEAKYSAHFATTLVNLNGTRTGGAAYDAMGDLVASFDVGNRTGETNLGDFAADAVLWQANRSMNGTVQAAMLNGGGIRETLPAGDLTRNDLITVFPFNNVVTVLEVKGSDLLEVIEAAVWCTPIANGSFPQVAGMELSIDTTVPYVPGEQYPGGTGYAPAEPGSRVTIHTVGGQAFDPDASYTIAVNDYMAMGGDNYYPFTRAAINHDTGVSLEDALINYVNEVCGGVIGLEYAQPKGRIKIDEDILSQFTDLDMSQWYVSCVRYAVKNGYIVGMGGGSFAPGENMTRVQYMTLLYRVGEAFGAYEHMETTGEKWFVPGTALANHYGFSWFTQEQLYAPITRWELTLATAKLFTDMYDGAEMASVRDELDFTDVAPEQAGTIGELYAAGLINGYTDGTFQPDGTAKRSEIAQIVYNMLEVVTPTAA